MTPVRPEAQALRLASDALRQSVEQRSGPRLKEAPVATPRLALTWTWAGGRKRGKGRGRLLPLEAAKAISVHTRRPALWCCVSTPIVFGPHARHP